MANSQNLRLILDDMEDVPVIKERYLTKEELKVLYEWMKPQYVNYENIEMHDLIKKIRDILENEQYDQT